MGLLKTTVATLTLAGAALYASHKTQLELIEREAHATLNTAHRGDVGADIQNVYTAVRSRINGYGGTYEFIAGDFDVRDGEARCGGIAALACIEGAARGFSSRIESEMNGLRIHYFAVLERDGYRFRFELGFPKKQTKIVGNYLADSRGK